MNLSISINQMTLHSKSYDYAKKCSFKQRLNLSIYAVQNQRDFQYWNVQEIVITELPK